ncbi:L,D-transpeptidase [Paenibacillus chitinolyticus]|uniref:L,D-transpeptidase n=1 Tax=Paenibacillus chitinolyticus TaxID=79263 RepID=UPI00366DBD3C
MSTEKPDEKLARFLRHNPIEDRVYLKEYVRDHPDQRMAWYLLGREYAARGDRGKAAYCYAQSGEIYEAFEKRKITVDWSALDSSVPWPQELKTAAKRSRRRKAALTAALLALIALLPAPAGPAAGDGRPGGSSAASAELPAADGGLRVYLAAEKQTSASGALERMLLRDRPAGGEAVLLSAQSADGPGGGWIAWHRPLKPLLSVASGGPGEAAAIAYFDAAACNCRPDDPGRFAEPAGAWRQRQEQLLVLRSALEAYRAASGKLPEGPEELLRPYPDNVMSGLTPYMREAFPLVREAAATGANGQAAAGTGGAGTAPGAKPTAASVAAEEALSEPLAILIDTKLHRLALVSGRTVVRSYEVGLGGARTPLGEFVVSEKVRDPKGRKKGEFGTRGMTLSDTDYAIHGTRHPSSIGKDESLGCIRMREEDVEELFDMAPKGTKVTIGSGLLPAGLVGDGSGGDSGASKGSGAPGAGFGPKGAFKLPSEVKETNPGKVYRWLD